MRSGEDRFPEAREPIALVGIGCRFPGGVDGPGAFWRLLRDGVDAITEVPPERWASHVQHHADPAMPGRMTSRWGGFLEDIDRFDAQFFGISPREACRMDPQHRLLLEVAWEAFEDAGQPSEELAGTPTGVYVGISCNDYYEIQAGPWDRPQIDAHTSTGSARSIAANRISYTFDLRGPSLAVDTACSSSLVAVHLACQALWNGEVATALAGGVNAILVPAFSVCLSKLAMLSPDGRCRAFDARGNGYVRAEGAGIVVLKRLSAALAGGDRVYAVIRGTAVNQDGATNGITVPSVEAQQAAVRAACRAAGVPPSRLQYVEAHGTGTPVGDPLEAAALGGVLREGRPPGEPCRVGSVKTNFGHAESAAGIAGLIKTALALHHREIPASLHFRTPSPEIPLDELRLRVAARAEPWPAEPGAGLAGVNSFGFGGTNAHVVVGEPPAAPAPEPAEPTEPTEENEAHVFPLSARSGQALRDLARSAAEQLRNGEGEPAAFADLCWSAAVRRGHRRQEHRAAFVARSREELAQKLAAFAAGETGAAVGRRPAGGARGPVFVFCGQGPQHWAMGRELLRREPRFRAAIERCDALLRGHAGWSLLDELSAPEERSRMDRTDRLQPAVFAIQVALAELWRSWGVEPAAVVGHSLGEIAAAQVAGALSPEDAAAVVFHRSRLQHRATGTGKMLSAELRPEEAAPFLDRNPGRLWLAAVNGPRSITLAGDGAVVDGTAAELERAGVFARVLRIPCACHTPHMEPFRDELLASLAGLKTRAPEVPLWSTVHARLLGAGESGAGYWWENFRRPVLFRDAVRGLAAGGHDLFLEIGPHPVLSAPLRHALAESGRKEAAVLPSLRRGENERETLLASLAALHAAGVDAAWPALFPGRRRLARLPSYPWQRERHWLESEESRRDRLGEDDDPVLGRRQAAPQPSWQQDLDLRVHPWLADHRIQGALVVPGVFYILTALAAARSLLGGAPALLERVELQRALFVPDDGVPRMRLELSPENGAFEVFGRAPDRESRDAQWTRHARGSFVAAPGGAAEPRSLDAIRERCPEVLDGAGFYAAADRRGIQLGGAFQKIEQVRLGRGEALARIRVPAAEGPWDLHPTVLDACFQAALALLGEDRPGLYLPVRTERIRLFSIPAGVVHAHVRVVDESPRALRLDMEVLDGSGRPVGEVRGLRFQSVESHRQSEEERIDRWLHVERWEPATLPGRPGLHPSAADLPRTAEIAARVRSAAGGLFRQLGRSVFYDELDRGIHDVAGRFVVRAFQRLGWRPAGGEEVSTDGLAAQLGVLPRHGRLFERLLGILEEEGILSRRDGAWRVERPLAAADPETGWRDLSGRHPAYVVELSYLWRCGQRLAEVLRGQADALELLFPDGSLSLAEHLYQDAPISRLYNRLAACALAEVAAVTGRLPGPRTLRVLEVGGGTAGMTAHVLPSLPAHRTEYVFTDVSGRFLAHAEQKLKPAQHVRYRLLDVQEDPEAQGLEPGSFDLVLASDCLHATRSLLETLGHLRRLLRPGGLLVALEATRRTRFSDVVFGLTEGWWGFADPDVRPDHPLLVPRRWREVLAEAGFGEVALVGEPVAEELSLRHLLLAEAPGDPVPPAVSSTEEGRAASGDWLVFADRGGAGERLAGILRAGGGSCVLVEPAEAFEEDAGRFRIRPDAPEDLDRLFAALGGRVWSGAIHLWSLDAEGPEIESTAALAAAQTLGVESVLLLLQALERSGCDVRGLVLVTREAQPVGSSGTAGVGLAVARSPLWGLGRVVPHEHRNLPTKLVDLGAAGSDGEVEALAAEILAFDAEEEVALRGRVRYVHRVVATPSLAADPCHTGELAADPGRRSFQLETSAPGLLDNLALRMAPRREPGPGEVEVQVCAAGLNFKDLMIALGLLADEAVERSYGGPLLGTECAGRVAAIGEGVEGLRPGDEVIALAPSCFAPFVITAAHFVVPKPASLGFEEAAGLPIAFLTAWHAFHDIARLQLGEKVLIHSASGGAGLAAIQVALREGAEVIATAGREEKREYLRALGIEHVFDSRSLAFAERVLEVTGGRGVDVVLNSLSGRAIQQNLEVLAPYGRYLEIGKTDIYQNSRIGLWPFQRNLSFFALDMSRLCLERPAMTAGLLREVMPLFATGELRPIPFRPFPLEQGANAFRTIGQARHLGKLVLSLEDQPAAPARRPREGFPFRPDRTWLVTGGLGGFGLELARWLVDNGARHLLLIGRREPSAEALPLLEELRARGARVETASADVADEAQLDRALASAGSRLPPLAGIFHAAMVLSDALLSQMDRKQLHRALDPKMLGAWNLHRRTRGEPIEQFVLFSSVAGVLGSAGQGNYAAGNTFLDALAHHRRALGLPALAVDWGRLGQVGYVARHGEVGPLLDRQGILEISPAAALDALAALLRQGPAQAAVGRVDWRRWARANPASAGSLRLRHLAPESDPVAEDSAGGALATGVPVLSSLAAARPEARGQIVEDFLREQLARVLGTSASRIDPQEPLTSLGLDSLMAIELRNRIQGELSVDLPVMRLLSGTSLRQLAPGLLETQAVEEPPAPLPAVAESVPVVPPPPPLAPAAEPPPAAEAPLPKPLRLPLPSSGQGDLAPSAGQRLLLAAVRLAVKALTRPEIEGLERVPRQGPLILAANHLFHGDALLLAALLPRRGAYLAGERWGRMPLIGWLLRQLGEAIFVARGEADEAAIETAAGVLRRGGCLTIAPEGTLSRTGGLLQGKTGVAYLATRTGAPVLPVAASGQEQAFRCWRRLRRVPIRVRVGDPLALPQGAPAHDLRRLTDRVMLALAGLLPESYRGVYAVDLPANGRCAEPALEERGA